MRIKTHPALGPTNGGRVTFTFNGDVFEGVEGEPIAFALWAAGVRTLGRGERGGEPRGIYCGIGHCYSCRVTVDGEADVRACIAPLRAGMTVRSQEPPEAGR